jgi:glycosyltransferase involved in cell wall biosynthesis
MNIAISSSAPPDAGQGISAFATSLAVALNCLGHNIYWVSPSPRDREWLTKYSAGFFATDMDQDEHTLTPLLYQFLSDHKIEAVISNDNPILHSLAPCVAVPFIAVGHMVSRTIARLACYGHDSVDYVVSLSPDIQARYQRRWNVPVSKSVIIYNGVEDTESSCLASNHAGLNIVFAGGGQSTVKGSDLVLQLVDKFPDQWEGGQLHWYGSGVDKIRLSLKSKKWVHAHGLVERKRLLKALEKADILLMPSRIEACSMLMLEAMCRSTAIISANGIGSTKYIIRNGIEGRILDIKQWPDQASTYLKWLATAPNTVIRMKRTCRTRYKNDFDIKNVALTYLQLIESILEGPSKVPKKEARVIRWHRLVRPGLAGITDRIASRTGFLRLGRRVAVR